VLDTGLIECADDAAGLVLNLPDTGGSCWPATSRTQPPDYAAGADRITCSRDP
jgi:hypothetical protein